MAGAREAVTPSFACISAGASSIFWLLLLAAPGDGLQWQAQVEGANIVKRI